MNSEQRSGCEPHGMEYFKYSATGSCSSAKPDLNDMELVVTFRESLSNPESTTDYKKYILSMLATSREVKAYRMLEDYVQHPDEDVSNWAYMALMESRISLESELSDEKQIYISTGLGGKGEKLRFYVLMLSRDRKPFQEYQRKVIEREFAYFSCRRPTAYETERLTIGEQYVELVFLIPVRADIKLTLDKVINECNQYGDFLSDIFTITNVKELTQQEVTDIINKNGNSKTSH
ncbi:MAG: hypothetical protein ACLVEJ_02765 [Parabacteroides sp.]